MQVPTVEDPMLISPIYRQSSSFGLHNRTLPATAVLSWRSSLGEGEDEDEVDDGSCFFQVLLTLARSTFCLSAD
jgi:hypothetical protein